MSPACCSRKIWVSPKRECASSQGFWTPGVCGTGSALLGKGSFCSVGRMDDEGDGDRGGEQALYGPYSILVISLCSSSSPHGSALCLLCPGKSYTCPPVYHSGLWLHLVFYSHGKALAPSLFSGSSSPLQSRSAFVPCQPSASREVPKPHSSTSEWKGPG